MRAPHTPRLVAIGATLLLALAGAPSRVAAMPSSPLQLYAFGYNGFGQLGNEINDENEEANPQPVPVIMPAAAGPLTQIAAGEFDSLALTSMGQAYGFGDNFAGQLGSEVNSGTLESNPAPTPVSALPGASGTVSEIAAGAEYSLLLTSGGQLYAFGSNQYGQLGSATNAGSERANPTPALVALPGAGGPVSAIAAGANHSLALTSTGQLYAFGDNRYGQLGSATNSGSGDPNPTPSLVTLPGAGGTVTEIAAGSEHSLARISTGQLFAFGWNGSGQLGSEANSGTPEPNPTPTLVALPAGSGPVTQIAAGGKHSLVLTSGGRLYAFGDNEEGQLGTPLNNGSEQPNPAPALVELPGANGPVTQIAAGRKDSLVVTSSGQLYTFGDNIFGQLGTAINSATTIANPTPRIVALPAGAVVVALARGPEARHTLALVAGTSAGEGPPTGQVEVLGSKTTSPRLMGAPEPPTMTSVNMTSKRFRVARQATAVSAQKQKVPLGTRFRLTLSAAAQLRIAITRSARGVRVGRDCVAPAAGPKRRDFKRCTRRLTVGTLTRANEPKGADTVAFTGRIGHRALTAGVYGAILTASDAAGRSRPITLAFAIVR